MFRSFLSWRYLKSRATNWIGVGGVFVGVGAMIMILSIMTGFLEETRRTVRGSLSDILVKPYFGLSEGEPGPSRVPGPVIHHIEEDERVVAAAPHLVWWGQLSKTGVEARQSMRLLSNSQFGKMTIVQIVGIDLEAELRATEFGEALRREPLPGRGVQVHDVEDPFASPPEYKPEGRPRPSVIVGEQLFDQHRLRRGQTISLNTLVPDAEEPLFGNREFIIAGTFRSGENEMDLQRVYVQRQELADFLQPESDYNEILVRLKDYKRDGLAVRDSLRKGLSEVGLIYGYPEEVKTWEEFRGVLLGAIENERALMGIMLMLVLIVASFTIFAILSMMVTEKRRDIGIMTALGATRRGVMSVFLMIAFWDALIGATLGMVVGTWAAINIDAIEQWLSRTFGIQIFNRDVYLFDTIPSVVDPLWVAVIVLAAFVLALLFAAIPAWRASRLDPLEALRYE